MRCWAWLLCLVACGDDSAPDIDAAVDAALDVPGVDAPGLDAPIDAPGVDSAFDSGTDSGVDAGIECECPTLPASCDGITLGPVFSPDDANFGQELMQALACADDSLHAALYDVKWDCLANAFAERLDADADLELAIVTDDGTCPFDGSSYDCALDALADHPRVEIVLDGRPERMRHNFVTFDSIRTWVSSADLTEPSFCDQFNHSLVIEDSETVFAFEDVFFRMFFDRTFGPVPIEPPRFGGVHALYFSPQEPAGVAPNWFNDIIEEIGSATIRLDVMMRDYDAFELTNALLEARDRGVAVRVLVGVGASDRPAVQTLRDAGVEVRTASMGHRVLIADTATVIAGSADYTARSWDDSGNSLWIGDATIADAFVREMDRIWSIASD